jgi:hypothetical protein
MARRLTDTYFVKCSFSVRFETSQQILSTKTSTGIYVIPECESLSEYIKTKTERQVKDTFGDDYKIADFVITEITPL